jgi:ribosomal protein S6--L-glutamate ligase
MDIGVVTVRDGGYHPNRRLLEAAGERGLNAGLINPYELSLEIRSGRLGAEGWGRPGLPRVVLPRQGAEIGESSLTVLRQLAALGIHLANDVEAIFLARNKFLTMQTLAAGGIPVPDTAFINSRPAFFQSVERLGGYPLVVKKPSGRQGAGVFRVDLPEQAEAVLDQHLDIARGLLLQQYIAPGRREDLRALVVGGRVVAAMALSPAPGDFRSNYFLTGRSRAAELSPELQGIALQSAAALGLEIAGVDLIIDAAGAARVIEVNYAPGFRGLEAATGLDVAGAMIDYAAALPKDRELCGNHAHP